MKRIRRPHIESSYCSGNPVRWDNGQKCKIGQIREILRHSCTEAFLNLLSPMKALKNHLLPCKPSFYLSTEVVQGLGLRKEPQKFPFYQVLEFPRKRIMSEQEFLHILWSKFFIRMSQNNRSRYKNEAKTIILFLQDQLTRLLELSSPQQIM